ncbi:MAG: D-alanine--D-alanine ligase [Candidatus Omnitrophica bacterium]|nr:D-alanine--D-alanine ligase [Candidatus Omnitrophota bacterium]
MAIEQKNSSGKLGRIGVLMGGPSTEREVSLKSGKAVCDSLKAHGAQIYGIDITTDNRQENIRLIKSYDLDCAFIALHGRFGEDGQIQELLDELKIPYTGSGALASKLAMDKAASLHVFEVSGLTIPRYEVVDISSYSPSWKMRAKSGFPLVVKPANHGSSIGLSIIDEVRQLDSAVALAFSFDSRVIIQEYIPGREITVGILDNEVLPVIEIIPSRRFFDYKAKYQPGLTDYIVPARLDEAVVKRAQETALSAHLALGCFGCSRVDMILDKYDIPFILEINTIPGLTQTSLLPKAAKVAGIDFTNLCIKLIELAYEKTEDQTGN